MACKKIPTRKEALADELEKLLTQYDKALVAGVDNVTSNQMHEIRKALRGEAVVYCGKNTQIRRVITNMDAAGHTHLAPLLSATQGNVALVFTHGDLKAIKDKLAANTLPAAAKAGALAQKDFVLAAGPTPLEPTMTSLLHALNIASKISRGSIELLHGKKLLTKGEKVDASSAALLQKLGVTPFSYGLVVKHVFDSGSLFSPDVLDISSQRVHATFRAAASNLAAISLQLAMPTAVSVPYSLMAAFSNLVAVTTVTECSFKEAEDVKAFLADPTAFALPAEAPVVGVTTSVDDEGEEEYLGMGVDPLFGPDGGDDY